MFYRDNTSYYGNNSLFSPDEKKETPHSSFFLVYRKNNFIRYYARTRVAKKETTRSTPTSNMRDDILPPACCFQSIIKILSHVIYTKDEEIYLPIRLYIRLVIYITHNLPPKIIPSGKELAELQIFHLRFSLHNICRASRA